MSPREIRDEKRLWRTGLFRAAGLMAIFLCGALAIAQSKAARSPPPESSVREAKLKVARETYVDLIAGATTLAAKRELAKSVLETAENKDTLDAAERFALFELAREIALDGRDGLLAFQIADKTAERFVLSRFAAKGEILDKFAEIASNEEEDRSVMTQAAALAAEAESQEEFTAAVRLRRLALAEAKKVGDKALLKTLPGSLAETEALAAGYPAVESALLKLAEVPDDPTANEVVGKYRCFCLGDWDRGVAMLALARDPILRGIAIRDLGEPVAAEKQLAIADEWYETAQIQDSRAKRLTLQHAAHWYRKAVTGSLDPLAKLKAEKRSIVSPTAAVATVAVYLDDMAEVRAEVAGGRLGKHGASSYSADEMYKTLLNKNVVPAHALAILPPTAGTGYVVYDLRKQYSTLESTVTIGTPGLAALPMGMALLKKNGWQGKAASPVVFCVYGDNRLLWKSRPLQRTGDIQRVNVSVAGVAALNLTVECGGLNTFADAMWIDPLLSK